MNQNEQQRIAYTNQSLRDLRVNMENADPDVAKAAREVYAWFGSYLYHVGYGLITVQSYPFRVDALVPGMHPSMALILSDGMFAGTKMYAFDNHVLNLMNWDAFELKQFPSLVSRFEWLARECGITTPVVHTSALWTGPPEIPGFGWISLRECISRTSFPRSFGQRDYTAFPFLEIERPGDDGKLVRTII